MKDLKLIDGVYYYKGIFTALYEGDIENEYMKGGLLMIAKNTIDAILNNTLFDHIMNSKFGDFNFILNILENSHNDKYDESFKVIMNESGFIDCIHIGELVIKYIRGKNCNYMKFLLHDKTFMYKECITCSYHTHCERKSCDHIINHKLITPIPMVKSARN